MRYFAVGFAIVLGLLSGGAQAVEAVYRLHYTYVMCSVGPCPDWQVIDRQTGEEFVAVVDFSRLATRPPINADLVVEASRARLNRPSRDGTYELLTVTAILETSPAPPGNRP